MKHGDRIICLVGKSGSGKTSIAKEVESRGFNVIQSFTTRPARSKEEWGHTFVDDVPRLSQDESIIDRSNMIAYTLYNGYHYWATKDQYQGKGITLYVIDPPGVALLKERVFDAEIVVVYLEVDISQRRNRMWVQRRDIKEVQERIVNDEAAFGVVECDIVINANKPLPEVVKTFLSKFYYS